MKIYHHLKSSLFVFFMSLALSVNSQTLYCDVDANTPIEPVLLSSVECSNYTNYSPIVAGQTPIKIIRIAFHIFQKSDGSSNFQNTSEDIAYLNGVINKSNFHLANLGILNMGTTPFIVDSRIRLELEKIYFHPHDEDYMTPVSSVVYNKYVINDFDGYNMTDDDKYNVQHIIISGNPTDVVGGSASGIGSQGYIRHTGWYAHYNTWGPSSYTWRLATNFIHELGHSFGCSHNFHGDSFGYQCDGCTDNDPTGLPCPIQGTSTNYMDYPPLGYNSSNPDPGFSQCQLSIIHYRLSGFGTISRTVKKDFCEVDLAQNVEILENSVWNSTKFMKGHLIIKTGNQLTVKCKLYMPADAKVIIEPGARLIVDEGEITSACGDYWAGIEVWGNSSQFQNSLNQGHLIVRNGGIIEFAQNAVLVGKEGDATKGGGLVQATNSTFRNNFKNVKYLPYNFYSFTTGNEVLNKGRFLNCEFLWNDDLIGTSAHSGFDINHVNGVIISGCTFKDDRTTVTNPHERPFGIISLDAGYKVLGRNLGSLNSPIHHNYDETNMDVSYFKNLREGIYAMNALSQNSITVDHAKFEDMVYGIHLSSVDNAILTRNMFNYTFMHPSDISVMHEMALSKSTGFTVEGNIFMKQPATFMVEGTLVYNSGFAANRIYRNTYENLYTSNYANGENTNDLSGGDQPIGLQFLCNDYSFSNKYDEYVYTFPNANGNGQGIRLKQGTSTKPAGNTFSLLNPGQGKAHIKSLDFDNIIYFAYNSPPQVPTILDGGIGNQLTVNQNTCLSTFNGIISPNGGVLVSSTTQIQLLNDLQTINSTYQQKSNELSALLADGNTQYLHDLVANLSNSNRQTVKAELLNASPYLSEELLIELGEKTPSIFPPMWYKSILEANVEIVQNKSFIYYLNNKPDPLAPGLVNNIIQYGMTHSTIRGTKMDELTDLNTEKSVILNYLISNEMSDSSEVNWTAYKDYLVQRDDIICRAQLADMYLGKRETSECDAKLDDIDVHINEYMVDEVKQEMMDYSTFKKYILNIIDSSSLILSLTPEEITQLNYVADNFRGKSSIQAKNLLCYLTGQCEDLLVEYGEGNGNKMADGLNSELITVNSTNLEIMPNPNIGEFNVKVPNDCAILNVYVNDIQGRKVEFSMDNLDGNKINLEIKEPESGIYLISVECQGETFTSRIIVK